MEDNYEMLKGIFAGIAVSFIFFGYAICVKHINFVEFCK